MTQKNPFMPRIVPFEINSRAKAFLIGPVFGETFSLKTFILPS